MTEKAYRLCAFFCLGGFISSLMAKRIGGRWGVCAGAILTAAGFILTSRLNGSTVISLYVAYGLLAGFGIGCAYVTTISTVSAWFPDKKGFCSGCLMMGFCASTLLNGNRYFATNFSVMNFNLMGASMVATLANGLLASSSGYTAPLSMLLTLAVAALVLNLSIKRPYTKGSDTLSRVTSFVCMEFGERKDGRL